MEKIYGIIYWKGHKEGMNVFIQDDGPYPYTYSNGIMATFATVEEADKLAYHLEQTPGIENAIAIDARVISLDGVMI